MIDRRAFTAHPLDQQAVQRLIPHRPPLLLIDGADAISTEPPGMRAFKHIRSDEPVFAGHFPSDPLWPGAYCIEGLAQTCALLGAVRAAGATQAVVLAAADVKLTAPVRPDCRLDYLVAWTFSADGMHRFDVEASVGNTVVAKGVLTLVQVAR